tara:strand:+ start:716 stop:1426 length:711 start_codon:yes stop_codon:yes gene_type:complete
MKKLLILSLITIFFTSCGDDVKQAVFATPSDYQPLKIGAWYVYDVDSITYNDFTTPVTVDSFKFQLKEEITDTFTDQAGRLNFRLERSKRFYNDSVVFDSLNWKVSDVWFITENGNDIERVEENNRFISLLDPVKNETTWDGNAFNFMDNWDYTYLKFEEPFDTYGNTVTVNQIFEDKLVIIYQLYEEVYAKDIGLVNRIRIDVESQNLTDPSIPVLNRIEKGSQYFQKLNDYYIP